MKLNEKILENLKTSFKIQELPEDFEEKCSTYFEILKEFNQVHSLTNYKASEFPKIMEDSLAPLEFLTFYPKKIIDIGSGAGFPAVFLSFILKNSEFFLFEPNMKKAAFLTYLKINLDLDNIKVLSEKIQESQPFIADLLTSRALMKTKQLLELSSAFYDENSEILLYKGSQAKEEIKEIHAKIFTKNNRNYVLIKGKDALEFLAKN